jgi:hypothetical protein
LDRHPDNNGHYIHSGDAGAGNDLNFQGFGRFETGQSRTCSATSSVLSLLEAASASGNAVVFARLTELYEKALNTDAAVQAQGNVS